MILPASDYVNNTVCVPKCLAGYGSEIPPQMAAGSTGKNGMLRLEFGLRGRKTVILRQTHRSPLHAQRALYTGASSSLARVYLMSSSGGILQGDRYNIEINVEQDAAASIMTQGATRIYGMDHNLAIQKMTASLAESSYLEILPDQIIPYADSRYYQSMECTVGRGATLLYSETVTPGRSASGESFEYDVCCLATRIRDSSGKYVLYETANLEPKRHGMGAPGVMGEYDTIGTAYVVSDPGYIRDMLPRMHDIPQRDGTIHGMSLLARDSGILVRALGRNTEDTRAILSEFVDIVRANILIKRT